MAVPHSMPATSPSVNSADGVYIVAFSTLPEQEEADEAAFRPPRASLWGVKIRCAFPKNADLQVGPDFSHPTGRET